MMTPDQLQSLASPNTLKVAGRFLGIGDAEANALMSGKVPAWFWVVLGVAGGTYIGVQLQRKHPEKVRKVLK